MTKRQTLAEFTAKAQAVHGTKYTYQGLESRNSKAWVRATCPEHGEVFQSVGQHLRGTGCPACGHAQKGVTKRSSKESVVQNARLKHGDKYVYGDLTYSNSRAYLDITCPEHGIFNQNVDKHLSGQGCPECGKLVSVEKRRWTLGEFREAASKVHGQYTYTGIEGRKAVIVCPEHGEFKQGFHNHLIGQGCPTCGTALKGTRQTFEELVLKAREVHGDRYTYRELLYPAGSRSLVVYTCLHHGEITQIANDHLGGHGCAACSPRVSQPTIEVAKLLKSWGVDSVQEVNLSGTRKTLDIYVEPLKLAIEYNGNYWHSSKFIQSSAHKERSKLAEDRGIRLVHIFSHEWRLRRPAVETLLKRLCNVEVHKVAARKCKVVTPSKEVANAFLELNHIQGGARTGEFVGLEHEGKLVAVMVFSFNTSNRNEAADSTKVELTRYASSCTVVGGFSKLMKAWLKLNPVKTVVSYSDNRLFTGKVYELAGFKKIHTTQPDYKYLESGWDDTLHHKSKYQKKHLVERFGVEACEGKTERQITEENSIYQVYDCGKTRWEFVV